MGGWHAWQRWTAASPKLLSWPVNSWLLLPPAGPQARGRNSQTQCTRVCKCVCVKLYRRSRQQKGPGPPLRPTDDLFL